MDQRRQIENEEPHSGSNQPEDRRIRVLIVDDSEMFHEAAHAALAPITKVLVVGRVRCGIDAMEQVSRNSPDLVLADLVMPSMDGFELTRRLKAQPVSPKVIILTQFNGPDCREGALAAGADAYLPKQQVRQLPDVVGELFPGRS